MRARLRTLSKENAEVVGCHLVMAGRLLDLDPERAYEHAQAAVRRGGRVDVVREAAGLAAYRTGRHAEALRELRTVRRISGSTEHLAVMADCERGLGRPERAIALADDPDVPNLPLDAAVELAIVVSGARLDLDQPDAAVAALDQASVRRATGVLAVRVAQARAVALEAAGRADEAAAELAPYTDDDLHRAAGNSPVVDDDIVVYDLTDTEDDEAVAVPDDDPDGTVDSEAHGSTDDEDDVEDDGAVTQDVDAPDDTVDSEASGSAAGLDNPGQVSGCDATGDGAAEDGDAAGATEDDDDPGRVVEVTPADDPGTGRGDPPGSGTGPTADDRDGTGSDQPAGPVEVAASDQPVGLVEVAERVDERREDHTGAVTETVAPDESVPSEVDG